MNDLTLHIDAASRVNGGWVVRLYATYSSGPYRQGFMQVRTDEDFNITSFLPESVEQDVQFFLSKMRIPIILGIFPELE